MERKITIEESVPYTEDYQNKMLEENQVEGLLEMHGRGMDDKSCYDYDVSGKVSMKALYEKHTMSGEEIKILLKSILRVVKEVERYLLNVNCILMDPEYIFYTEEKYYFCYYPPKEKSLWEGFHHLSEYLVKCADYQDKECVQIVFLLHKETMKENYSLEQIIKECVKEEEESILEHAKELDERVKTVCSLIWARAFNEIMYEKYPDISSAAQLNFTEQLYEKAYEEYYNDRNADGYTAADRDRLCEDEEISL